MGILIDASILIEHERGRLDLARQIKGREEEQCFLSIITASELLHGVFRASKPEIRTKRSAFVETILRQFPLLPLDLPTARIHAHIWAGLAATGNLIGSHDLWLSATCIANGYT